MTDIKNTPMIDQYLEIKNQYRDAILFFRLGDFYEMFFADAEKASRELEIVLTARESGTQKIPMCGIPYHSASNYIARLIDRGFKVAICEQVEDPKLAKGIVRREVTRVITPGTVMDDTMLEDNRNNYLAAISEEDQTIGLAFIDVSTGQFRVTEFKGSDAFSKLGDELNRIAPSECLVQEFSSFIYMGQEDTRVSRKMLLTKINDEASLDQCRSLLLRHFQVASLEAFGLADYTAGIRAAAAIISFLNDTQKTTLHHIMALNTYRTDNYLEIDHITAVNLELTNTLRSNRKDGTLFSVLNYCCTAMGRRMLRSWIELPLMDIGLIYDRYDALQTIKDDLELKENLKLCLSQVHDLERLAGKIGSGLANPRDILGLKLSLAALPAISALLSACTGAILTKTAEMDLMQDVYELIENSLLDQAPFTVKEGDIIKTGYNADIDELRQISRQGSTWLVDFENREKQRTGIKYLKVGYNKIYGYYIEVSKSNLNLVPPEYHRKQTLVNTERFIIEELKIYEDKIVGARERLYALEYEQFVQIRDSLIRHIERIQHTARQIATLDVLFSLAEAAYINDYNRPLLEKSGIIDIKSGRHPVVEKYLHEARFVPNDVNLNNRDARLAIITGPNMGGKSTFMRQTALLVIMAQMGSFIPADRAKVGIANRVFARVGASDDLAAGQSTFMVEMLEVANILNNAGPESLILLDEIGRGTSTYDGLSIARAVSEYIVQNICARTMFATHYHELTTLSEELEGVVNLSVSVNETGDNVVFMKKVLPGKADKSYGIHVARMAGLPRAVIKRAGEILESLEKTTVNHQTADIIQPALFGEDNIIINELRELHLDELSPREALMVLYRWKEIDAGN